MRQYKVQLTPRARKSITDIVSNLRQHASPTYATKVRRAILETIKGLKTFPESHQEFDELSSPQEVYRRALTIDYKIVYTIQEDVLEVIVVQVYHQSRGQEWIDDNVEP